MGEHHLQSTMLPPIRALSPTVQLSQNLSELEFSPVKINVYRALAFPSPLCAPVPPPPPPPFSLFLILTLPADAKTANLVIHYS